MDGNLRVLFRQHLPGLDWQSIETGGTGRGIPDANFCHQGIEGWIEFKLAKGWTCPLRPEQIGWLLRRSRFGGRCFVATRQRTRTLDTLHIHPGVAAGALKSLGLRGGPLALFIGPGGPRNWDWPAIQLVLLAPK